MTITMMTLNNDDHDAEITIQGNASLLCYNLPRKNFGTFKIPQN